MVPAIQDAPTPSTREFYYDRAKVASTQRILSLVISGRSRVEFARCRSRYSAAEILMLQTRPSADTATPQLACHLRRRRRRSYLQQRSAAQREPEKDNAGVRPSDEQSVIVTIGKHIKRLE